MQKISFGNRDFVKAVEVAKRFKYTQDYVGQLCRGDKVDARLVGRTWYVNIESVTEYRKTKHSTQKKTANKKPPSTASKRKTKRSMVEPVVRPKTARKLQESFPRQAKNAVQHLSAKYSRDKESTIPVLGSTNTPKSVTELPAQEAKATPKVTIKVRPNTRKSTKYHAEKIPEITLKSKLKVTDEVENLVPETVADAESSTGSNVYESSEPSKKSAPVNFHPTSVVTEENASGADSVGRSRGHSGRSLRFRGVILSLYVLSMTVATALVLGAAYVNETGSPVATSGLVFSVDQAIEKILEMTR